MKIDEIRKLSLLYAAGKISGNSNPAPPPPVKKRHRKKLTKKQKRLRRQEYEAYINSPEWALFRSNVFAKRGRKCEDCGSTKPPMHVHHIHYRTFMKERPEDVKVLCEDCHIIAHGRRGRAWQRLTPERRREIASMGGKASKAKRKAQQEAA